MRKTISLILIFILSANPAFAFGQVVLLASPLLLRSIFTYEETSGHLVGVNSITQQLNNAITWSIHGPGIDEPLSMSVSAPPQSVGG